jgi:hypothetical protein
MLLYMGVKLGLSNCGEGPTCFREQDTEGGRDNLEEPGMDGIISCRETKGGRNGVHWSKLALCRRQWRALGARK